MINFLRDYLFTMPVLAKFAVGMVMLVVIPRLSRQAHIPATVGLLLGGVIAGRYVLDIFGKVRPIADFLAELGKLLLMFFAGLEINLALFRRARHRSIALGIATTVFPLLLGTIVGLSFGYGLVPAIVIGSLLASHTLLGLPIVSRLGLANLESVTVAVGATVMSDTLSLVVFAICVSIYTTGFSPAGLALLLAEIVGYILLVLFGLSRLGAYVLKRVENEEDAYFVLMLSTMAIAGVLADAIRLPGIVRAFLAGLAINASAQKAPASLKLEFLSKSFFIPIFFVVTGFLIDPIKFVLGIFDDFFLVASIIGALLVGKWMAAWAVGHVFGYSPNERLNIWSLTLPQVAATLAATLVARDTLNSADQRLLDDRMFNVVLVLVFVTSVLGPMLTERFASRLSADTPAPT
jgi:Kef-type K+ transport system membrane component KefB